MKRYLRGYYNLIEFAKSQNRSKSNENYYENHHIIPKSFGGNNESENLVLLTAKEHYIAHYLLTKFTKGDHLKSMIYAFHKMNFIGRGQKRYTNSRLYEKNKIRMSKQKSIDMKIFYEKNGSPLLGKSYEEILGVEKSKMKKQKISESNKKSGKWKKENNPGWGKFGELNHFYGRSHSEETKLKISEKNKGKNVGKKNVMSNPEIREKHKISCIKKQKFYIYLFNNITDEEYLFYTRKDFEKFCKNRNDIAFYSIDMKKSENCKSYKYWKVKKIFKDKI